MQFHVTFHITPGNLLGQVVAPFAVLFRANQPVAAVAIICSASACLEMKQKHGAHLPKQARLQYWM